MLNKASVVLVNECSIPSSMGEITLFHNGLAITCHSRAGDEIFTIAEGLTSLYSVPLQSVEVNPIEFAEFIAKAEGKLDLFSTLKDNIDALDENLLQGYNNKTLYEFIQSLLARSMNTKPSMVVQTHDGWKCSHCTSTWGENICETKVPKVCHNCIPSSDKLDVSVNVTQSGERIAEFETKLSDLDLKLVSKNALKSGILDTESSINYIATFITDGVYEAVACEGEITATMLASTSAAIQLPTIETPSACDVNFNQNATEFLCLTNELTGGVEVYLHASICEDFVEFLVWEKPLMGHHIDSTKHPDYEGWSSRGWCLEDTTMDENWNKMDYIHNITFNGRIVMKTRNPLNTKPFRALLTEWATKA